MKNKIRYILQKGISTESNEKERQEMLSLFHQKDKENELKDGLLEQLNEFDSNEIPHPDYKKLFSRLWAKIEQNTNKNNSKPIVLLSWLKIAAVLFIGIFTGFYINSKIGNKEPVYYTAHSPKGSISEMVLPDSSLIFLNADSRIKYSFDGKKGMREVFLDGEAWFDVTKNAKKPFIVHTSSYDVKVTGTQFNIKAYSTEDLIATTLESGQVTIHSSNSLKITEDVVLKPGEQLSFNKESRNITIRNVNTKWYTSWKENKLIFVNMSMKELVILLNRRYGVDIEVKNKDILDLHFDGTFKNESIVEVLEIIKNTLPVEYNIVGQKIEITNAK